MIKPVKNMIHEDLNFRWILKIIGLNIFFKSLNPLLPMIKPD